MVRSTGIGQRTHRSSAEYNRTVATELDRLHRRASRFLRDLDAGTSISNPERLDFIRWLQYELARRAAPLEPPEGEAQAGGSGSGFEPVYL
jgi:hypothetical protein